jgi:hypothetical protein
MYDQSSAPTLESDKSLADMLEYLRVYQQFVDPEMKPKIKAFTEAVFLAGLCQGRATKKVPLDEFIPRVL